MKSISRNTDDLQSYIRINKESNRNRKNRFWCVNWPKISNIFTNYLMSHWRMTRRLRGKWIRGNSILLLRSSGAPSTNVLLLFLFTYLQSFTCH